MLPYLKAVGTRDEVEAFNTLARILVAWPFRLWHPYTYSTLQHLSMLLGPFTELPKQSREQVRATLNDLVVAWALGLTGYEFSPRTSYAKRGRTLSLFPALDELRGPSPPPEAWKQLRWASKFVEVIEELKARLAKAVRWRYLRNQYRKASAAYKPFFVEEAAEALQIVFVQYVRDRNQTAWPPPTPEETKAIAKKALSAPLGRNPTDTAAYEFLSLYPLGAGDHDMKLTPSLIRSTLSTLSKRGISPNFRSHSRKKSN